MQSSGRKIEGRKIDQKHFSAFDLSASFFRILSFLSAIELSADRKERGRIVPSAPASSALAIDDFCYFFVNQCWQEDSSFMAAMELSIANLPC